MSIQRAVGMLLLLTFMSACSGGDDPNPGSGPKLPNISALTDTTVGAAYDTRITATGGVAPLRYALKSEPPPGFSFYSTDGRLTGPASVAGDYTLAVSVVDVEKGEDSRPYTLKVWPAPVIADMVLATGVAGSGYTLSIGVTGGRPPVTFSVTEGAPPEGLSLSQDGELTGIPRLAGTTSFSVKVVDASGVSAQARYSVEVKPGTGTPDGGGSDGGTDGGPTTSFPLAVANWNIEWFGHTGMGPSDEALQLANVRTVIAGAGVDVWGLAEVVDAAHFEQLKAQLPEYEGFLASDSLVSSGSFYYDADEQKVGILYKKGLVQVREARIVLGSSDYYFAGRPPLRVDLRVTRSGTNVDLSILMLHMKATSNGTESSDYERRLEAGQLLKSYLDSNLPTQRVMVVGDWNDDVDVSTVGNRETPYRNFVDDAANYRFVTMDMSLSGIGSTVSRNTFIDHQLVSNEMLASYVPGSAAVLRPNITRYGTTTSDHYPIISRYNFGQTTARTLRVTAPNGGEVLAAGSTFNITWASSGVQNVRLQYSLDNGVVWSDVAASVAAASGSFAWTVPSESSSTARVRINDAADTTLADVSDGPFTLNRPVPTLFINEYLPQPLPPSGSNTPDYDKMFVEVRNTGASAVNLGGYSLHDAESRRGDKPARHVFASGTMLQPGAVYTVYSGASAVPSGTPNTAASNGGEGLRFNRGKNEGSTGDSVYLVRPDGSEQDHSTYDDTFLGVSYNRNPDGSGAGEWVRHDSLSSSLASPGRRVDGSAF
ncbi:lamin tail domain-containing protein [Myxococcus sp. K38C18041901]|uniref:lamin tail domain-containing protein n=1 Tax=Myxococcus guangdongensis TaxID=2906760 RepID=UPI0020A74852|nr:lamin tail domain-containing protein [Myxococcus guangdongensis]MCP3059367.1 lamin tail domain-containing protein [Myxococcus guangdongensis]